MRKLNYLAALIAAAVLLAAGCTTKSDTPTVSLKGGETVEVKMTDSAYTPNSFSVAKGATVTFKFVNDGKMTHEAFIGTERQQVAHEGEMTGSNSSSGSSSHSGMDMGSGSMNPGSMGSGSKSASDDAHMVSVPPGGDAELIYAFDKSGTMIIGCHQPGHWSSGMKATIKVT